METVARIVETRLIPLLRPQKQELALPLLAALCSGGICAAEFTMEASFTPAALQAGSRLFPDLVLGAGGIRSMDAAKIAIQSGARYLTSPGYAHELAKLCRDADVLYLPQCTTPSELLAASIGKLPAAGLFAPHLWAGEALIGEFLAAFPKLTTVACRTPWDQTARLLTIPGIAACTVTDLPCDSPEALATACVALSAMRDSL